MTNEEMNSLINKYLMYNDLDIPDYCGSDTLAIEALGLLIRKTNTEVYISHFEGKWFTNLTYYTYRQFNHSGTNLSDSICKAISNIIKDNLSFGIDGIHEKGKTYTC
jgi:hypothetical protein